MNDAGDFDWLSFSADINADGQFTFMDVWLWTVQLFFLPGDVFLWLLLTYLPGLASFLELGPASYRGLFTAIVSVAIWLIAIVMLGVVYSAILNLDRALTTAIVRLHRELKRRARVLRTWAFCQARRSRAVLSFRRHRGGAEIDLDELDLDELELEVLRSHALLAPGYVLSVSDLAASLELRRGQAQQLIDKLEKLALLQRSFGDSDGATGYRLSQPGRFVVMAKSRIAAR